MEGRVPPTATTGANTLGQPPSFSFRRQPQQTGLLPPPSAESSETYIVQIPRDQIYRVPPPENARIVENFRNPYHQKGRRGGKWCLWILVAIVFLAAVIGGIVAIVQVFFSPKTPEFSVTKVLVKHPPASHKNTHANHPSFEISLKVTNPNERMSVSFKDGGQSSLSFNEKTIAQGKYPSASQDMKSSSTARLTLASSTDKLPSEIEKSMKNSTSKKPVSLSLTINVPVKLKNLVTLSKDMSFTCDFKVSNLSSGSKILSQQCNSKF